MSSEGVSELMGVVLSMGYRRDEDGGAICASATAGVDGWDDGLFLFFQIRVPKGGGFPLLKES